MRKLLRCRRGSVAFATVVALVPLIGVVSLGAEAGSWYVIKQRAQNAADAAAYSGGLKLACSFASSCADQKSVDYRGKQVAAQNAFCNADDSAYPGCPSNLPSDTSRKVVIASLASWNGVAGNYVQATVSQKQPAYLAKVLGVSSPINIAATAAASVVGLPNPPCGLALTGSLSFQGSPNITAPNCSMATNSTANNALDFTGGGATINLSSLSASGGCTGAAQFCSPTHTYMPPVNNPFSALDGALTTLCGANPTLPTTCGLKTTGVCNTSGLVAYTAATPCTNNNVHITSNGTVSLSGVYFISGTLKITGTPVISGTATFILLPGAAINNQGNATITINGPTTVPPASSFPSALQSIATRSLFQYMSMYDASNVAVQFGGNSNINLTGNIYAPTASVTFQGNPTITLGNGTSCGQLIAASIAFNGNATLDSKGCPATTKPSIPQYVKLVP